MEECTAQVETPLKRQRRQYRLTKVQVCTVFPTAARQQQRRGILRLWARARERHVQARLRWRDKLNRYLIP